MIDITTYITEGGFFTNTGANKYIDIIKNFGKILAQGVTRKELAKARWLSKMPNTDVYKRLYDLFNDTNNYKVEFDVVYNTASSIFDEIEVCTQHWIGIRNGDEFSLSCDRIYKKHPENNGNDLYECKNVSELLSKILYYVQFARRLDILQDTAKFTIK